MTSCPSALAWVHPRNSQELIMLVLPHCVGGHLQVIQCSLLTSVTAPYRVLLIHYVFLFFPYFLLILCATLDSPVIHIFVTTLKIQDG